MKRRSRVPVKPVHLCESSQRQLSMYALAAGAAGVGMLVAAPHATAGIVYTPAHVTIGPNGPVTYNLDLNHDGLVDFTLGHSSFCDPGLCVNFVSALEKQSGNAIAFGGKVQGCLAMPAGAVIGPKRQFYPAVVQLADYLSTYKGKFTSGNWVNVSNHYLGLKFQINGQTHYGWARLNVSVQGFQVTGTLTGYAYETVANQPIIAGQTTAGQTTAAYVAQLMTSGVEAAVAQPASLGLLAQGVSGLAAWRREDEQP